MAQEREAGLGSDSASPRRDLAVNGKTASGNLLLVPEEEISKMTSWEIG